MKPLFSLLFLFAATTAFVKAQDTLYLNSEKKTISKKKNAAYLKVVTKTDTGYVLEFLNKQKELENKITYKDPDLKIMDGYSVYYHGKTMDHEGRYLNGKRDGVWKYYHQDGNISGVIINKDNQVVSAQYFKPSGEKETDPKKIEQLPSYPGGMNAMAEYISRNVRYPQQSRKDRITGQVKVGFTISATGEIMDIAVLSGVNDELNHEAIRAVRSMPNWIPGVQFNRPVKVRYTLPINFNL